MMLIDKRQEIASKLEKALADRANDIANKVFAYKTQLEAEPLTDEVISMQKVLAAIDEVISYEAKTCPVAPAVKAEEPAPIVETVKIVTEINDEPVAELKVEDNKVEAEPAETARPGMAYIGVPERR